MAYSVQSDWELAAGGAANLVALSDLSATGRLDLDVLDRLAENVDSLIDSYLRSLGMTVPLTVVPPAIRDLSAKEVVFNLRNSRDAANEGERLLHEQRMQWLRDLGHGAVIPWASDIYPAGPTDTPPSYGTRSVDSDDAFARDAWSRGGFG